MDEQSVQGRLDGRRGNSTLDRAYLVETLSRLARVPTDVPLGFETLMEPDDPKLVHYVQAVLRPELVRLGCYDLIDAPRNNLIVRLGSGGSGRSLSSGDRSPETVGYADWKSPAAFAATPTSG